MPSFRRRAGLLTVHHKYFCDAVDWADRFRLAVYYQPRLGRKPAGFIGKPFYTILNPLDIPEEGIFKRFTSTVRNEVRRSEREGVQFGFMEDADAFRRFQNDFAQAKGAYRADEALLEAYRDALTITCATLQQRVLAAHAYLCDAESKRVRLLLSSSIRLIEGVDANLVGRANKFLHFRDMVHFKRAGYLVYDFGGIAYNTKDKQRQGINSFKQSFGGKPVEEREYQSWPYWLSSRVFYGVYRMLHR